MRTGNKNMSVIHPIQFTNTLVSKIDQFTDSSKNRILDTIKSVGGKVLLPTVSLCQHCHYHVPAYRYELNNKIYLCKHCIFHGISHHPIENDAEFYHNMDYDKTTIWNFDRYILTEVTDRCNLECPHCYHLPHNKIKDVPMDVILQRIREYPELITDIILAGAESSLRKDIHELVVEISNMGKLPQILTNGVKFSDEDFVKQLASINRNLVVHFGLNHPSYIDNTTIRAKQIQGIHNINKYLPGMLSYIGYTLVHIDELDYILDEICFSDLYATTYRIRCGSEIGRNASDGHVFVSDIIKLVEKWSMDHNLEFSIERADNNIYHTVVKVGEKIIRLIHWCDETNIDMEELRGGPWCDFVPDSITNFLHQVIRRDVWKNKNIILPDKVPLRYLAGHQYD